MRTRDRILEKAVDALSRDGIDKVSLQRVADKAGISQTAVLHHFKNKDALIESAIMYGVAHCRDMLAASVKPEDDAYERLIKYGYTNCSWALRFPKEAYLVVMLYYLAAVDPRFAAIYAAIRNGAQDRIREFLLAGVREGVFKVRKADRVHEVLHGTLIGILINAVTSETGRKSEAVVRQKWRYAVGLCTGR